MSARREFRAFLRQFVFPLLLVLAGGGLLGIARPMGSAIVAIAGIALLAIGLLWMFISCLRNGIDFFDL